MNIQKIPASTVEPLPVLIADNHLHYCQIFSSFLSRYPRYRVEYICHEIQPAKEIVTRHPLSLAFVNYEIGNCRGHELASFIRQFNNHIQVIATSHQAHELKVLRMLDAGAKAFLGNHDTVDDTGVVMDTVMNNNYYFNHSLTGPLFEQWLKMRDDPDAYYKAKLTPEEILAICLVYYKGFSHQSASMRLGKGITWLDKRFNKQFEKTGCHNFMELLHYCFRFSIICPLYMDMSSHMDNEMKAEFEKLTA